MELTCNIFSFFSLKKKKKDLPQVAFQAECLVLGKINACFCDTVNKYLEAPKQGQVEPRQFKKRETLFLIGKRGGIFCLGA